MKTLWRGLEQLALLEPDFVSVTYGAGGSTRDRTLKLLERVKAELGIEPLAHLTCVGATRDELCETIDGLGEIGVENILALRGDPPRGSDAFEPVKDGLSYASDLVSLIRSRGDFCIGAACYPEVHPEAPDAETDLRHLKHKVDCGVDFLVSQLFFENEVFFEFESRARAAGIDVPILPGIMPVSNVKQLQRFTTMCGASIPRELSARLELVGEDPVEVFWAGVMYAAHQCRGLLAPHAPRPFTPASGGVPGVHFYTLNKSPSTRAIFEILRLTRRAL